MSAQLSMLSMVFLGFIAVANAAEKSPREPCETACIDVFGGALPIPPGYRLQPNTGDVLRLVRIDRDPTKPYGNIYIGTVDSLPPKESREKDAKELGASFERRTRGTMQIELMIRTSKQLLADKPARYVSALLYDERHYVRITDSDPNLWNQMIEQCKRCGSP